METVHIVVGKELDKAQSVAAQTLRDALATEGITADIKNDGEAAKSEFEILVGLTNREESVSCATATVTARSEEQVSAVVSLVTSQAKRVPMLRIVIIVARWSIQAVAAA